MKFDIIKNNLDGTAFVRCLKIKNDDYTLTFSYMGDYTEDKNNHNIDIRSVQLRCQTRPSNIPLAITLDSGVSGLIDEKMTEYLSDDADFDRVIEKLKLAKEARAEVQKYYEEYFLQYTDNKYIEYHYEEHHEE